VRAVRAMLRACDKNSSRQYAREKTSNTTGRRLVFVCACFIAMEVLLLPSRTNVWVKTVGCHGFAKPIRGYDGTMMSLSRKSSRSFTSESGFCVCAFTSARPIVVANRHCGKFPIDCDLECDKDASKARVDLSSGVNSSSHRPRRWLFRRRRTECFTKGKRRFGGHRREIVDVFHHAMLATGKTVRTISAPNSRKTITNDFVYQGKRMRAADVAQVRVAIQEFLHAAPAYPTHTFRGQGIVIVGGSSLNYATTYWIALLSIRRAGCALPVDIWFPKGEFPTCRQVRELGRLGATPRSFAPFATHGWHSRFAYKLVATIFSDFESVLYMDADNIALRDPSVVFDSALWREHGAVLFKDFWRSSAAPDLFDILPDLAHESVLYNGTHETGQVFIDKPRVWPALMLAHFMNVNAHAFVPLTVNYMGWGDKELLPRALQATHGCSYGLVRTRPEHVGVYTTQHRVFGNSMLQRFDDGEPMFLHANVGKINRFDRTTAPWRTHVRRWQYGTRLKTSLPSALNAASNTTDFERWVFDDALAVAVDVADDADADDARHSPAPWYASSLDIHIPRPVLDGMYVTDHPGLIHDDE